MGREAVIGEVEAVLREIRKVLLAVPELSSWPAAVQVIERPVRGGTLHCWDYPVLACRAVGGTSAEAVPGAAAIFCLLYSIHLVDDMLDEDPRGSHQEWGAGRAANLALALQATAPGLFGQTALSAERRASVLEEVALISLRTAYGQELDLGELSCEEDYWQVVAHKTPPLFAGAFAIGALLGGASVEVAQEVREVGSLLGRLVQVSDDVKDALARPAEVDWRRPYSNLAILYALSAEHPLQHRFKELLPVVVTDAKALAEAQDILVRSGAISFCVYQIVSTFRTAQSHLSSVDLDSAEPLAELLSYYLSPIRKLFETVGEKLPEDLALD